MKYRVIAYRTRTCCRVWVVPELYGKPIYWGPWKTLRRAKQERTALNKDRVVTVDAEGNRADHGPSFRNVRIEEVL